MLEAVESMLCSMEVLEVMHRVLLCMLEDVEGRLCSLEVMNRVLLCMLEAVEGEVCLMEVLRVPEVMRCVVLCIVG